MTFIKIKRNPRAFISFDYHHDKASKDLLAGQFRNTSMPVVVEDWSSKKHLPQREWENLIESKISGCRMVIVLVGRLTYTAEGVVKEITFAKNQSVPVFGIYASGAGAFTPLPTGLTRNQMIRWSWDKIKQAVDNILNN
ncbi:MAG: TIR domain-containing protein [Cyclobacteriaceae bacterium]